MWCKTLLFSFLLPLYSLHTTSFKWIPGISWNFFLFSFISLGFVQNPSFNLVMAGLADFVELGLSLMSETKDIRSSLNHGDTFDFFFFSCEHYKGFLQSRNYKERNFYPSNIETTLLSWQNFNIFLC